MARRCWRRRQAAPRRPRPRSALRRPAAALPRRVRGCWLLQTAAVPAVAAATATVHRRWRNRLHHHRSPRRKRGAQTGPPGGAAAWTQWRPRRRPRLPPRCRRDAPPPQGAAAAAQGADARRALPRWAPRCWCDGPAPPVTAGECSEVLPRQPRAQSRRRRRFLADAPPMAAAPAAAAAQVGSLAWLAAARRRCETPAGSAPRRDRHFAGRRGRHRRWCRPRGRRGGGRTWVGRRRGPCPGWMSRGCLQRHIKERGMWGRRCIGTDNGTRAM